MTKQADDSRPRTLWAEFLFSRVLVFIIARNVVGDTQAYFDGVSRFVSGGTPYGEDGFGYPVLAFFFVSLPWLLGAETFDLYYPFFRALCFAADVFLFYALSRRLSRTSLLLYIVCTALLANLLFHRLDIVLGCLIVAALALEARGSRKLAGFTLGAAVAFKVIPALLVPAWLVAAFRRSPKDTCVTAVFLALGAGGPTALGYLLWGRDAVFFMGEHADRGVQLESTWASVEIVLMEFGLEGTTYMGSGSYNLSTPFESTFKSLSHVLGVTAGLWGAVLAFRGGGLVVVSSATLGAAMFASKVFSPQFFLFFLPLLAWSLESMKPTFRHVTIVVALVCCALTTWVYPYHEEELVALSPVATAPLVARNVFFTLLVGLLQFHAWRGPRSRQRQNER